MDNKEIHNRYYHSSWHDDDGRSLSSISKEAKVKTGMKKWYTLKTKYNLIELELKNNIIRFSYKDIEFYYAIPSKKVREKGKITTWTGKISEFLKKY
jgi:hypothetical protein